MSIGALLSNTRGNMYDREYHKSSPRVGSADLQWLIEVGYMNRDKKENIEKFSEKKAVAPLYFPRSTTPHFIEEKKTDDYTRTTFSSNNPGKLDKVFYTWYSPEGIKCIREGERNFENPEEKIGEDELQWEIKFENPDQYDKIKEFLVQFPKEDNLRFTANEAFWNDFLTDKIDMDSFMDFYDWTDGGAPNMGMGENGEPVSLNKERMKDPNAEYFNDQTWIGQVWTEEEMWEQWYARIEASSAAQKAGYSIPVGGTVTGGSRVVFPGAAGSVNIYFKFADERGVIDYNGIIFCCDAKTDTLKLGDCSNPANCIQIPLKKGGTLMVNRDNMYQLLDAISFFSPKDMATILKILQKERMSENSLMELNREQDKIMDLIHDNQNKKTEAKASTF